MRPLVRLIFCLLVSFPATAQVWVQGMSGGSGGEFCGLQPQTLANRTLRLKMIKVRAGDWIDAIDLTYTSSASPEPVHQIHCGGTGGRTQQTLILDNDEFIVELSGRSGNYIDSLYLKTNKRNMAWGNLDTQSPNEFTYQAPPGAGFVGIHFRAHTYIDAIGVVLGKP